MGRGLKGVRDNVYIATKCHMTEPDQVRKMRRDVAQAARYRLRRLRADPQPGDRARRLRRGHEAARRAGEAAQRKDAALHRPDDARRLRGRAADDPTGGFDQVLLAYGYFRKGMDTILSNTKLEYRDMCLAKAADLGMAIVAMKVMGANIFSHNSKKLVADAEPAQLERLPGGGHPLGAARPAHFDAEYRRLDARRTSTTT